MPRYQRTFALLVFALSLTEAQPRITSAEVVSSGEHRWGFAKFTPDGQRILFSTLAYDGIWEHTIATKTTRQLTADAGAGYGFEMSTDGSTVLYRRTVAGRTWRERRQEVVSLRLTTKTATVLGAARTISTPVFDGNSPAFVQAGTVFNPSPSKNRVVILGVDGPRIQLLMNGTRKDLEPFPGGAVIWPSLSPDRKRVLAYDMERGAFVADLNGTILAKLGGLDAPVFTRDGAWVVAFDEVSDGHQITGSDLHAVRPDGTGRTAVTSTKDVIELYPSCSPTENKIVCHTLDGKILLMTYEVRP